MPEQDRNGEGGWRSRFGGDAQPGSAPGRESQAPWLEPVLGDEVTEEGLPFRKILMSLGVLVLMGLSAAGGYWAGKSQRPTGNLIVQAPDDPMKEQPASPGGMEVPNQDKLVLQQATVNEAASNAAGEMETIRPLTEAPIILPPSKNEGSGPNATAVPPQQTVPAPLAGGGTLPSGAPIVAPAAKTLPAALSGAKTSVAPSDAKPAETKLANQKAADANPAKPGETKAVAAKPGETKPAAKPDETKAIVKTETGAKPASGRFMLSLGAFSTEEKAKSVWAAVKAKSPALAKAAQEIHTVQAGEKTLYRLSAGPFSTKDEAQEICGKIASPTQACLITGK